MIPVTMDRQPDLLNMDEVFIEDELWLPSIKFKSGEYTDVGYRYQYQHYEKFNGDTYFPWSKKIIQPFYSIKTFNHDVYNVDHDEGLIS